MLACYHRGLFSPLEQKSIREENEVAFTMWHVFSLIMSQLLVELQLSPCSSYWLGWLIFLHASLSCSSFLLSCLTVASVTSAVTCTPTLYLSTVAHSAVLTSPLPKVLSSWGCEAPPRAEPLVQIKAKQSVRINGFIFFDTIVADKRHSLALGILCCWEIRMALTGVSEARRPDGPGQLDGVWAGKAGKD